MNEEWLQQQQSLFNFAKYEDFDKSQQGIFKTWNKKVIAECANNYIPRIYAVNLEKDKQIVNRPAYPDIVAGCTMKLTRKLIKKD